MKIKDSLDLVESLTQGSHEEIQYDAHEVIGSDGDIVTLGNEPGIKKQPQGFCTTKKDRLITSPAPIRNEASINFVGRLGFENVAEVTNSDGLVWGIYHADISKKE